MSVDINTCLPRVDWLQALQENEWKRFNFRGFPTKKEEHWKYTDTSGVAKQFWDNQFNLPQAIGKPLKAFNEALTDIHIVFIDGIFSETFSQLDGLPTGITLLPISEALRTQPSMIQPYLTKTYDVQRHPFACLNSSLMTDGLFIKVSREQTFNGIIRCTYLTTQKNLMTFPRNIIHIEEHSQINLIEEYIGHVDIYFTNTVTHISTEKDAKLHHFKIQNESQKAFHFSNVFIEQKGESGVNHFNLSLGGNVAREDVQATVSEKNASCQLYGLYELNHVGQHQDHHLQVDHIAACGNSSMIYKGVLNKKTRAVFNGKVFVHPQAKQIHAHQENHNLLLSSDAEINTKPELEIYADDVKCTHGATVGQLDTEALFYLRSRGIQEDEATTLLQQAFATEIFAAIHCPKIRSYLSKQVSRHE